jgi:hypothetical protein
MKMETVSFSKTFIPIDRHEWRLSQEAKIVMRIVVRTVNMEVIIKTLQMWQS